MKALLTYLLILISGVSFSQTWPKYYTQNDSYDYSDDIIEMYDKGYLICGNYNTYNGSQFKQWSWLIKTDINGNILWDKIIAGGDEFIRTAALEPTNDGGVLTCGLIWTNTGFYDPYVMKLNACGEKEWCKIFSGSVSLSTWFHDVKVTPSGEIIILAVQFEELKTMHLFRLSAEGDFLWKKVYCDGMIYPGAYLPIGKSLTLISEERCIISGQVYWEDPWNPSGPAGLRPLFVMVDSLGNEEWALPFGLNDTILGQAHHIIELYNGNFLGVGRYIDVSANIGRKGLIMNIDGNGNEISHAIFDFNELNNSFNVGLFYDILPVDSTYLLASYFGNTQWDNTAPPGELIVDTSDLTIIYNYKHYLNNYDTYNLIKTTSNKLIHNSTFILPNNNWDIFLTKLNMNLEYDTLDPGNFTYDSLCISGPPQSGFIFLDDCDIITGTEMPSPKEYYSFIATIPITAYPNPAETEITLAFQNTEHHTNMLLECYNIYGQKVHSEKIYKGQQKTKLNINSWNNGLYIAVLKSNGKVAGKSRFVVN